MISVQPISRTWSIAALLLALALSAAAQKSGKDSPSIEQIESQIRNDPNNPHLQVTLGLAYWDKNDYPHAFEAFQRAVKIGPTSAEAHNWLGVALMTERFVKSQCRPVAPSMKMASRYLEWGSLSEILMAMAGSTSCAPIFPNR